MRNKILSSLAIFTALILAGCSQTTPKTPVMSTPSASNGGGAVIPAAQKGVVVVSSPANSTQAANIYNRLNQLSLEQCISLADGYYHNADFVNALLAYDYTCVRFQDIPTCMKLGKMFEKGEGSAVDKVKALDIYQRACFGGYDPGCKEMKRLQ